MVGHEGGEESIFPLSAPLHSRQGAGLSLLHSHPCNWLACVPTFRANYTVLPRQSAEPGLVSAAVGEGQGQFSSSHDPRARSSTCHMGQGGGGHLLFVHATTQEKNGRVSSPTFIHSGWLTYSSHNVWVAFLSIVAE